MFIAASLSGVASLLHFAIIFGGAGWYRFFGAGERMARAVEAGKVYPAVMTTGIALMLALWSGYAFSAAVLLSPLPFASGVIFVITGIYLLRGLFIVPRYLFAPKKATRFWW